MEFWARGARAKPTCCEVKLLEVRHFDVPRAKDTNIVLHQIDLIAEDECFLAIDLGRSTHLNPEGIKDQHVIVA